MSATSPAYRQFTRQNYVACSEYDAGVQHLWHMENLARIYFRPSKGIQDAPDVDFRHPEEMDVSRGKNAIRLTRFAKEVAAREKSIYEGNQILLRHMIVACDDSTRRARHMHHIPQPSELVHMKKANQQAQFRERSRTLRRKDEMRQNAILFQHLVNVRPGVSTARDLDDWYLHVHKKRLRQLSRLRQAEPFAGANILRSECGIRIPLRARRCGGKRRGGHSPSASQLSAYDNSVLSAKMPLIAGHPYPPPTREEVMLSAPSRLSPTCRTTASEAERGCSGGGQRVGADAERGTCIKRRPSWQSIAKNDIPLMHYVSDMEMVHQTPRVPPQGEGGVTQMWRRAITKCHDGYESQKAAEERDCSTMRRASEARQDVLRRQSQKYVDRWRPTSRSRGSDAHSVNPRASHCIPVDGSTSVNHSEPSRRPPRGHSTVVREGNRSSSLRKTPLPSKGLHPPMASAGCHIRAEDTGAGRDVSRMATGVEMDRETSTSPHGSVPAAEDPADTVAAAVRDAFLSSWTHAVDVSSGARYAVV